MFCFNSPGDCGPARTRAPPLPTPIPGSQNPLFPNLFPNLAFPREAGNQCFPPYPSGMLEGDSGGKQSELRVEVSR